MTIPSAKLGSDRRFITSTTFLRFMLNFKYSGEISRDVKVNVRLLNLVWLFVSIYIYVYSREYLRKI